jgi:hypothetical protein
MSPSVAVDPPGVAADAGRWLVLVHHLPPKPDYLRVKVRRRLQRLGAVALKNSVYALPRTAGAQEDFAWLLREIVGEGGEAFLCAATLLDGIGDAEVEALFNRDRDTDYDGIIHAADGATAADLARLARRLDEVAAIDHFGAPKRAAAARALAALEARVRPRAAATGTAPGADERPLGRTWVTRAGVHVDRIASAWLIRRFIDPAARFRFVRPDGYRPAEGELRFDMFEAEYTHEGPRCTFETLLARFALDDPALAAIGEMVHDIDCKEPTFARAETVGVAAVIDGITATVSADEARIERGSALFDGLHAVLAARLADGGRGA